jgi:hypothetical protein
LTIYENVGDDIDQLAIAKQVYDSGKLDKVGLDPLMLGGLDGLLGVGIPQEQIIGYLKVISLQGYFMTLNENWQRVTFGMQDSSL